MRVVLFSSTAFGRRCLEHALLQSNDVEVVGVLTTRQEIRISYSSKPVWIANHAVFDDLGALHGFGVITGEQINKETYLEALDCWKPDLILVLGWYYMVPEAARKAAPQGCLGIHASLLPKYRGGAPLTWAILNGETETGVSLFCLEEGVDSGDIVAQARFDILLDDTIETVYAKAEQASISLLKEQLPLVASGVANRICQDESEATFVPQRKPEDGLIDWSRSAIDIHNFVRGQSRPYPGAFTYASAGVNHIWHTQLVTDRNEHITPGLVIASAGTTGYLVCCGDGVLNVLDSDFIVSPGEVLSSAPLANRVES